MTRDWPPLLTTAYADLNAPPYGTDIDYGNPPATATPALPLAAYTGSFDSDLYGELVVTIEGDELLMTLGPAPRRYSLTHYTRDVFTYQPTGENAYGPSAVSFFLGPDAQAERLVVENLDLHGQGFFNRKTMT
jgi:hypothetical protein